MSYVGVALMLIGALMVIRDDGGLTKASLAIKDFKAEVQSLRDWQKKIEVLLAEARTEMNSNLKAIEDQKKLVSDLDTQVDAVHEHLAKLREQQILLKEKYLTKRVRIEHTGSVPVSLSQPPPLPKKQGKAVLKRLDKQIKAFEGKQAP